MQQVKYQMSGQEFCTKRKSLGMTSADIGKSLDVGRSTISRWENSEKVPVVAGLAIIGLERVMGLS